MSRQWIGQTLGARRPLLRYLAAADIIVIFASTIAFVWSDTLHRLINVDIPAHLPLRATALLGGMAIYNLLFFRRRSLTLITICMSAYVLFFGAHDFLAATAAGAIVEPHLLAVVTRLIFVSLLLRIWLDDFFARHLQIGADKAHAAAPTHFSVQLR